MACLRPSDECARGDHRACGVESRPAFGVFGGWRCTCVCHQTQPEPLPLTMMPEEPSEPPKIKKLKATDERVRYVAQTYGMGKLQAAEVLFRAGNDVAEVRRRVKQVTEWGLHGGPN